MKKNHSNKGKIAAAITAASALTVALGITAIAAPLGGAPDASQKPDTNAEVRFEQEAGFAQNHNGPFSFEGLQNPDSPEFNGERPEGLPEFNGEKPDDAPDLLKDLLNAGIITQEEYDTISSSGLDRAPAGKEPMGRAPFESRQRPDLEWNQEASVLA